MATRDISILCANAGNATVGPVAKLDPAGERAVVQLNVAGAHDLVLAVLPRMIQREAGGILISGSAAGKFADTIQRDIRFDQSILEHFQRIVARGTARLWRACDVVGARSGTHWNAGNGRHIRGQQVSTELSVGFR